MVDVWDLAVLAVPVAAKIAFRVLTTIHDHLRRAAVRQLVDSSPSGIHIIDRTADGAFLEVTVNPSPTGRSDGGEPDQ